MPGIANLLTALDLSLLLKANGRIPHVPKPAKQMSFLKLAAQYPALIKKESRTVQNDSISERSKADEMSL